MRDPAQRPSSSLAKRIYRFFADLVSKYLDDDGLTRGAAISFYTVTSIAPLLVIVVSIVGLAYGHDAAWLAISGQISGLMGPEAASLLGAALQKASSPATGVLAGLLGTVTLIATASGAFGEMQSALNTIWRAKPKEGSVSRMIRARAVSIGLVAVLGFLLLVSLVVSAGITALSARLNAVLPFGSVIVSIINGVISTALIAVLFAAIFKVLPDVTIRWRDVIGGAVITAVLFAGGKTLIGWYIGSSGVASAYGAAGGLIVLLVWVYYSAQIFLLGAELTYLLSRARHSNDRRPVI